MDLSTVTSINIGSTSVTSVYYLSLKIWPEDQGNLADSYNFNTVSTGNIGYVLYGENSQEWSVKAILGNYLITADLIKQYCFKNSDGYYQLHMLIFDNEYTSAAEVYSMISVNTEGVITATRSFPHTADVVFPYVTGSSIKLEFEAVNFSLDPIYGQGLMAAVDIDIDGKPSLLIVIEHGYFVGVTDAPHFSDWTMNSGSLLVSDSEISGKFPGQNKAAAYFLGTGETFYYLAVNVYGIDGNDGDDSGLHLGVWLDTLNLDIPLKIGDNYIIYPMRSSSGNYNLAFRSDNAISSNVTITRLEYMPT